MSISEAKEMRELHDKYQNEIMYCVHLSQDQMANKITEKVEDEGEAVPDRAVESLLQQHQAQVANLTDQMEEERERQQRILQEKLQSKKLKKER